MARDQQGLALAGSLSSAEAFDRAVADYYGLTGDPVGISKRLSGAIPLRARRRRDRRTVLIGGFRGDHPEVAEALAAERRDRRRFVARAAPSGRRQGLGRRAHVRGDPRLGRHSRRRPDRRARPALRPGRLFLSRPIHSNIRNSAARVLPAWDRENPLTSFILGALRLRARGGGRTRPRRTLRRARRCAQSARRLGGACARPCHGDGEAERRGHRLSQGVAPVVEPGHFMAGHNGWHLAVYLIEKGASTRFSPITIASPAQARRRCDARPRRRRGASLAARTRGRCRRALGARWRVSGWRMSTIMCSLSTTCICLGRLALEERGRRPAPARSLDEIPARRRRRRSQGHDRGRPAASSTAWLISPRAITPARSKQFSRPLSGDPHRRQPRPARHRQPDPDRRGGALGAMESRPRAARRARRGPADRAHQGGVRKGAEFCGGAIGRHCERSEAIQRSRRLPIDGSPVAAWRNATRSGRRRPEPRRSSAEAAAHRRIRGADIDRAAQRCEQGLQSGDKFVNMSFMPDTRSVSWLRAARKDFEAFPAAVQDDILDALAVAAAGGMSAKAKPFKGVEGGVFEIAARHRGDAFRAIYAVKIDVDLWVIHAFQKKSNRESRCRRRRSI